MMVTSIENGQGPAGRALRSNSKTEGQERSVQPPPPEFAEQYFFKDFGVHGVFVGICMSMCKNGHKNGRDDIYTVQYDDGDVENLQYRDVRKMLKRAPADRDAWINAETKRQEASEALKKSEPAKHKQNTESAKKTTKIVDDRAGSQTSVSGGEANGEMYAASTSNCEPSEQVQQKREGNDQKDTKELESGPVQNNKDSKDGKVGKDSKESKSRTPSTIFNKPSSPKKSDAPTKLPKSPTKHEKKSKKHSGTRKRKHSSKSTASRLDTDIKRNKVKIECSEPGYGWLNHKPCQISRILSRRTRTVYEYEVEWAGSGLDRTWEPSQNIHGQLVNDFDRITDAHEIIAREDAQFQVGQTMSGSGTSMESSSGTTPSGPFSAASKAIAARISSGVSPQVQQAGSSKAPAYQQSAAQQPTPAVTQHQSGPFQLKQQNPHSLQQANHVASTTLGTAVTANTQSLPAAQPLYHTVDENGQCQHPMCQQQLLIDSYRAVLKFMEPPGWAETPQRVDQVPDSGLNRFPLTAFLEFYGHTIQEMMQVRDARVQLAEAKLAEAENRALAAETQVELLTAAAREKH